jgi:hypothetical protein
MKDLPKVFHNKIDKTFNNNKSVFYSNNKSSDNDLNNSNEIIDKRNVLQKINAIFSSPNYVYKANVEITLKDKKVTKRIIGRNKDYIITMDNDLIPIVDIIDIKSTKN